MLSRVAEHLTAYRELLPLAGESQDRERTASRKEAEQLGGKLQAIAPVVLGLVAAAFHLESNTSLVAREDGGYRGTCGSIRTARVLPSRVSKSSIPPMGSSAPR